MEAIELLLVLVGFIVVVVVWDKISSKLSARQSAADRKRREEEVDSVIENMPYLEDEDLLKKLFDKAMRDKQVQAHIGAALLLDVPEDPEPLPEIDDLMHGAYVSSKTNIEHEAPVGYFGNTNYIKNFLPSKVTFNRTALTIRDWYNNYLYPSLKAPKSTKFCLLWNSHGDIIGLVAYWGTNANNMKADFLPHFIRGDRVSFDTMSTAEILAILKNPNLPFYSFGVLKNSKVKLDWHPFRYEENTPGIIDLEEFIKGKWVQTGEYVVAANAMKPIKGAATIMTTLLLFDIQRLVSNCKIINEVD